MKKIKNYFYFHKRLKEALGEDLVYSLAIDGNQYILAVSVHKSKTLQFNHGRKIQSCFISETDLNRNIEHLIDEVIGLYQKILVPKEVPVNVEENPFNEIEGLIRI
jgi:hypothetical protein